MNGRERVEAVMRGTLPDRVPVMCQLSMGHLIKNSGISPSEFFLNYNTTYVDTLIRLAKNYQFDGVLVEFPGFHSESLKDQVDKIIDNPDGQSIVWKNGNETFCPSNDYPIHRSKTTAKKGSIMEIDLDNLPLPNEYKMKLNDLPEYTMEPYRSTIMKIGHTHSVHGFVATPLSGLSVSFSVEDVMVGLIEHPDFSKDLLDAFTKACITWVDNLIDVGVHAVCVSAPYEGSSLISKQMYEEFSLPYTARITEYIRNRGIPSYMHMCGSISDRLEAIVETGVDGIECLDPRPIGNVDLDDAVRRIGDKVFIKGNIDPVNTLLMKKPSEVYQDAVERIKIASHTKRFILSTACSVSPNTPQENLSILVKAVEDHGCY